MATRGGLHLDVAGREWQERTRPAQDGFSGTTFARQDVRSSWAEGVETGNLATPSHIGGARHVYRTEAAHRKEPAICTRATQSSPLRSVR